VKTEIPKLEKKLAEMREQLNFYRCCTANSLAFENVIACRIADCEKMLIHARILMLKSNNSEYVKKS
jgi:hypothetical protein